MSDKPKLLLVDDLEENLIALEAVLRRDDVELLRARSGREALELLLAHEVAVALIDVKMPEIDGVELAELMRGAERTRGVPIILLTAGVHDQHRFFEGYEAGAVDFLYKPLDPRILRNKVEVFLQLYRQKRQLSEQLGDLRRAEQVLREADRRKDDFLAMLSHELRNPLAPIRNSLFILQRIGAGGEQAKRARDIIERQVAQLARLVDDLLDVTRLARGKIQIQRGRVELGDLVRRAADDHRSLFDAAGVKLELALDAEPLWVDGDAARLAQVVGNLLGNSAKFTERGQVTLSLARHGDAAVIRVRDTGIGIEPGLLPRIFEPFEQADRSLARTRGGLGLGLALVKGVVELHGGGVAAASDGPGRGAEFTVQLPLVAPAPAAVAAAPPTPAHAVPHRVLIVEDNLDAAESMREVLDLFAQAVEVAHNGPEALDKAHAFRPDIVLCDIGLPGMDGYAVARAFRADPELVKATLVAVTGYASPDDRRLASEAGFDDHLAKPPSVDALKELLGHASGE